MSTIFLFLYDLDTSTIFRIGTVDPSFLNMAAGHTYFAIWRFCILIIIVWSWLLGLLHCVDIATICWL